MHVREEKIVACNHGAITGICENVEFELTGEIRFDF